MKPVRTVLRHLARAVGYTALGAVLFGGWFYVSLAQSQADLRPWHTAKLEAEYRGPGDDRVSSYADYVALENELFAELHREVYDSGDPGTQSRWSRYFRGGPQDSSASNHAWNRSVELAAEHPVGGALLLHGATDSPYSMRAIGELLHARGWHVVIPRYPGHGTAPVGLYTFDWRDIAEVAKLAAHHLREQVGDDAPLVMVGYSTGAGIAADYALAKLEGEDREAFDRIVLLSPAMGVSPIAAFAKTQGRLAAFLGVPKLAWTSIQPEYDPYKYNSFSVNAGDQVYELTVSVDERLARLSNDAGVVVGMPPILSFQSLVDATVSTRAVIAFHDKLASNEGHQLVIFDVDRSQATADFLQSSDLAILDELPERGARNYELTVVGNLDDESDELAAWDDVATREGAHAVPIGASWPKGVYSLTHVALPFREHDPVYGLTPYGDPARPSLGNLQLRGERGLFVVDGDGRMRLRCNPFFDYMAQRIVEALESVEKR
ncbi:MAG: alpha/beta fold hydrolase [Planctomycetes bacterium]|nr:alpha/beta fold hydrolase [Planctomycetota bacterium]MCB9904507.1 alpha/beta fold hydrolase [Planctomycetota bacterium]